MRITAISLCGLLGAFTPLAVVAQSEPLATRDFVEENVFLIDASCSAVFRLMADFGQQRGSKLVDAYVGAAGFMAGIAVAQHQEQFGTNDENAGALIQELIVEEHAKYLDGIQNTDKSLAENELQRFAQDVRFCNARMLAYEAKRQEAN